MEQDIILSAGEAKEIIPIGKMLLGFIARLILTLIIEIGIAILWMNLSYGMLAALLVFMLMEIFIIIFETRVYSK